MKTPNRNLLFVALLLMALPMSAADGDLSTFRNAIAGIDAAVESDLQRTGTPGAALVAIDKGEHHLRAFGRESIETEHAVTESTLFRLGSTTKMFVALTALELAQEGVVDLHGPVRTWAPELHTSIGRLTLHQLLSHTSGLRDEAPMRGPLDEDAVAARVASWDESNFFTEPDEIFSYANPGYVLAGYVIERAAGTPLEDLMRQRLFEPLGMTSTTFRPIMAMTFPLAAPHQRTRDGISVIRPFPENAANYAPGSLFTSALDLQRFLGGLLSPDLRPSLSRAFDAAIVPQVTVPALGLDYGYGFVIAENGGTTIVGHPGSRAGYGSIIQLVPEHRTAVAIIGNLTGSVLDAPAEDALRRLTPYRKEARPELSPRSMTVDEARSFAGHYVNNDREIQARLRADEDRLLLATPRGEIEVVRVGETSFRAPGAGPLTNFVILRSADDEATYLVAGMWATKRVEDPAPEQPDVKHHEETNDDEARKLGSEPEF